MKCQKSADIRRFLLQSSAAQDSWAFEFGRDCRGPFAVWNSSFISAYAIWSDWSWQVLWVLVECIALPSRHHQPRLAWMSLAWPESGIGAISWCRVSRLDSITSVHIRPDILHHFLDEMSRGWCYAGQPLCSDGQGAACTSCTSNFWCGHRCHGPVHVASLKVVLSYTWWGSQSRCFSHRWAKMTGKKCRLDPSMLCGRDSKAVVTI